MTEERDRPASSDPFAVVREAMVHDQLESRGIGDAATLSAMRLVPRETFVPESRTDDAYADRALSIGHDQTISQPYIVARMTALLDLVGIDWPWAGVRPSLLDIGTGSGYQAAVLAQCGAHVTSVERDPDLAQRARTRLHSLGYEVDVLVGDGSCGYPDRAPYSGIVVAAGSPDVPQPLVAQLADGARLVIPVGPRRSQQLTVVQRTGHRTTTRTYDACVFVPLLGRHGHSG